MEWAGSGQVLPVSAPFASPKSIPDLPQPHGVQVYSLIFSKGLYTGFHSPH